MKNVGGNDMRSLAKTNKQITKDKGLNEAILIIVELVKQSLRMGIDTCFFLGGRMFSGEVNEGSRIGQ